MGAGRRLWRKSADDGGSIEDGDGPVACSQRPPEAIALECWSASGLTAMVVQHAERHLSLSSEELIKPVAKRKFAAAVIMPTKPLRLWQIQWWFFTGALGQNHCRRFGGTGRNVGEGGRDQAERSPLVVGDQDLTVLAGHARSSKHRKTEEMQGVGLPIQIIDGSDFRKLVAVSGTT